MKYRKGKVKRVIIPPEWEFKIYNYTDEKLSEMIDWCKENNLDVDTTRMSFLFTNEKDAMLFSLKWL